MSPSWAAASLAWSPAPGPGAPPIARRPQHRLPASAPRPPPRPGRRHPGVDGQRDKGSRRRACELGPREPQPRRDDWIVFGVWAGGGVSGRCPDRVGSGRLGFRWLSMLDGTRSSVNGLETGCWPRRRHQGDRDVLVGDQPALDDTVAEGRTVRHWTGQPATEAAIGVLSRHLGQGGQIGA